jgi:hypothetical protein
MFLVEIIAVNSEKSKKYEEGGLISLWLYKENKLRD